MKSKEQLLQNLGRLYKIRNKIWHDGKFENAQEELEAESPGYLIDDYTEEVLRKYQIEYYIEILEWALTDFTSDLNIFNKNGKKK